jgi:hypothetical protein
VQIVEVDLPEVRVARLEPEPRVRAQQRHPVVVEDPPVVALLVALDARRVGREALGHATGEGVGRLRDVVVDRHDPVATRTCRHRLPLAQLGLLAGIRQDAFEQVSHRGLRAPWVGCRAAAPAAVHPVAVRDRGGSGVR